MNLSPLGFAVLRGNKQILIVLVSYCSNGVNRKTLKNNQFDHSGDKLFFENLIQGGYLNPASDDGQKSLSFAVLNGNLLQKCKLK